MMNGSILLSLQIHYFFHVSKKMKLHSINNLETNVFFAFYRRLSNDLY